MNQSKLSHILLNELIKSQSVSSDLAHIDQSNRFTCEILANYLSDLHFNCELQAVDNANDKWNLIASYTPDNAKHLAPVMFSGHTDTVPAEAEMWNQDPWKLESDDEYYSGLGVTDMKGFFIAVIQSIRSMRSLPKVPITLIATADEETTMAGARELSKRDIKAPLLNVIGEPTNLVPIFKHKGYFAFKLTITSEGGHSSINQQDKNCISAMFTANEVLEKLRTNVLVKSTDTDFSVPFSTLNLGTLHAGNAVNRICDNATLLFDIRPLPGISFNELREWLITHLKTELAGRRVNFELTPLYDPIESFKSSLSTKSQSHICQLCNHSPIAANYVTEASIFERMNWPSLILGPGDINQAHQINEQLSRKHFDQSISLYRAIIEQFEQII